MKASYIYIVVFVIGCFVVSCQSEKTYQDECRFAWTDFETKELKGHELVFDEDVMSPYHLILKDSFLLTLNQGTEKLCHVFNLNSKKKIIEKIMVGQGPEDMIHPFFVDIESGDSFQIYEPMNSNVYTYSLDSFLQGNKTESSRKIKLSESPFWGELSLLDDKMVGSSYRPDAPCYVFGSDGKKQPLGFGEYPKGVENYTNMEVLGAYRSIVATNKKNRVAVCHMFTDLIDFYDENGTLLKRMHGPEHFYTPFIEFRDGNMVGSRPDGNYYRDAFYSPLCVGEYLFVLYNGKFVDKPNYDLLATNILVFDWDGNPVCRYKLDKGVSRIAVDVERAKIYGISDNPEYHIVEFDYKQLK